MKTGQKPWSREELLLAINLYCKIPFGKLHSRNPEIIDLANTISRTPGSVAYKLVNFASLDPSLKAKGIKGAANTSKLDKQIWDEFYQNWDNLPYESEMLRTAVTKSSIFKEYGINEEELPKEGKTREQIIKARVNQGFFRRSILAAYNHTCCITGMQQQNLLVSSHIKPWAIDVENRMNPHNGLAMNCLHDKAFENGLLTITPGYKIRISSILFKQTNLESINTFFIKYHDKDLILPSRFLPDPDFLKYHINLRFKP